ncbi:MAG TPA: ribosome silencing factor [Gallionellaceae bacterium]
MLTVDEKTQAVVAALEDIKANDILVLDTSHFSSLFERMVIASAQSTRQTKALADNVVDQLRLRGEDALGIEGADPGEWILVDLGEVVVHIMQPAVRAYYNLEELWNMQHLPRNIGHKAK